jgi:aminoglycoside 3-N-acetyltransferase
MKAFRQTHSKESLAKDLTNLGVRPGQTLLIHASMRAIGCVEGGAEAVVTILRGLVGQSGTLVVPTGTANNSASSRIYLSQIAGMTVSERRRHRAAMPGFDPATTPSFGMGVIAEVIRMAPGALRSAHPQTSFAAWGLCAKEVIDNHAPTCHLGERSPLGRLYDLDASILLLGVGYQSCSAFHLAEYRYRPHPPTRTYECVVLRQNRPLWWRYRDIDLNDSDFGELGLDFENSEIPFRGIVGDAECRLLPYRSTVDYAGDWFRHHRVESNVTDPIQHQLPPGRPSAS